MKLLNDTLTLRLRPRGETQVPGDIIFKLYDTYGFPADIVRDVVRDENMSLDMEGFDSAMDQQRARSRSVTTFASISEAYKNLSAKGFKPEFRGYQMLTSESKVLLIVADGSEISEATAAKPLSWLLKKRRFMQKPVARSAMPGKSPIKTLKWKLGTRSKTPPG